MTIASELTDLATNLQNAKDAVTAKGGTVGDTGLAGLAAEIQTIPNGGGQAEPSNGGHITGYDTTTGVITGDGFGSTQGTVYLLDRDTNSYVSQPTTSWSDTSITLTTPVDTSTIEGHTSLSVVDSNGLWATKWLITGDIAVTNWGIVYVQDPDTRVVRKITMTSSNDTSCLTGMSGRKSIQKTVGSDTFYTDEVVGFQLGSGWTTNTLGNYTLYDFPNLNQPIVLPDVITTINTACFDNLFNFNQPFVFPANLTSISQDSFQLWTTFNQPLNFPSTLTSIARVFLSTFTNFNQPLTLPSNITYIPPSFLQSAYSFDCEITLPSSLTTIDSNFMNGCNSFDQKLTIPNTVTSIGANFLNSCNTFNNEIVLPSSLTAIGNSFVSSNARFNKTITIPSTVTSIGDYFLSSNGAFNQPITLPTNLTTIGTYFLSSCQSFNHPIILPSTITSIGQGFMQNDESFNYPLTLPSSITNIGNYFLSNCYAFSSLEANTTAAPTDTSNLSGGSNYGRYSKMNVKGITVTGSGASTWIANLPNRTSSPWRNLIDGTA